MYRDHALPVGTIVSGGKHHYRIKDYLRCDCQGFLYRAQICFEQPDEAHPHSGEIVLREQFMGLCSTRGADGQRVETEPDLAPTVEDCLNVFKQASQQRYAIACDMPNIINVEECFEANNTYYYAVDYLDGETLEEYVKRHGPFSVEESYEIMAPLLQAVEHIHAFHTIHAAITPQHIRFVKRPDGKTIPVLFHLYASIHFNDRGFPNWNVPYLSCHDGYAPPEQYRMIDHFCPQTDIFSLAAVLVYMQTGRPLPKSLLITEKIIRDHLPPALPETYVNALVNALQPQIENRTSSVTAFREGLMSYFLFRPRFKPADERSLTSYLSWGATKSSLLRIIAYSILILSCIILAFLLW